MEFIEVEKHGEGIKWRAGESYNPHFAKIVYCE